MISPYVRRLRLASELRAMRSEAGLTHEQLARRIGTSRAQISRLENGHVVDQADIIAILDALGVQGDRWSQIVAIARQAGERGWWESHKEMGQRQALYANLEAGAATIREFQMSFIPGLLQTSEFARARVEAERGRGPSKYGADQAVEARKGRQLMLCRPDGPSYEVILDEVAVRRRAVPAEVARAQLYHVSARVNRDPRTTVRVLPVTATIAGYGVPRSAFSIFTGESVLLSGDDGDIDTGFDDEFEDEFEDELPDDFGPDYDVGYDAGYAQGRLHGSQDGVTGTYDDSYDDSVPEVPDDVVDVPAFEIGYLDGYFAGYEDGYFATCDPVATTC